MRASASVKLRDATEKLLSEGSRYGDLTIEQIAKEAGIAKSTFYFHFEDKPTFLVEAVAGIQDGFLGAADRQWFSAAFPLSLDDLAPAFVQIVDAYREHQWLLGALVDAAAQDPATRKIYRAAIEHFEHGAREHLERGVAGGHVSEELDPGRTAGLLAWTFERGLHQMVRGVSDDEAHRYADTLARMVWQALYTPGA
jgi:AcrR family transcriptional regulator